MIKRFLIKSSFSATFSLIDFVALVITSSVPCLFELQLWCCGMSYLPGAEGSELSVCGFQHSWCRMLNYTRAKNATVFCSPLQRGSGVLSDSLLVHVYSLSSVRECPRVSDWTNPVQMYKSLSLLLELELRVCPHACRCVMPLSFHSLAARPVTSLFKS